MVGLSLVKSYSLAVGVGRSDCPFGCRPSAICRSEHTQSVVLGGPPSLGFVPRPSLSSPCRNYVAVRPKRSALPFRFGGGVSGFFSVSPLGYSNFKERPTPLGVSVKNLAIANFVICLSGV